MYNTPLAVGRRHGQTDDSYTSISHTGIIDRARLEIRNYHVRSVPPHTRRQRAHAGVSTDVFSVSARLKYNRTVGKYRTARNLGKVKNQKNDTYDRDASHGLWIYGPGKKPVPVYVVCDRNDILRQTTSPAEAS